MACGSMVFKFESTYKEFFEPALKVGTEAGLGLGARDVWAGR